MAKLFNPVCFIGIIIILSSVAANAVTPKRKCDAALNFVQQGSSGDRGPPVLDKFEQAVQFFNKSPIFLGDKETILDRLATLNSSEKWLLIDNLFGVLMYEKFISVPYSRITTIAEEEICTQLKKLPLHSILSCDEPGALTSYLLGWIFYLDISDPEASKILNDNHYKNIRALFDLSPVDDTVRMITSEMDPSFSDLFNLRKLEIFDYAAVVLNDFYFYQSRYNAKLSKLDDLANNKRFAALVKALLDIQKNGYFEPIFKEMRAGATVHSQARNQYLTKLQDLYYNTQLFTEQVTIIQSGIVPSLEALEKPTRDRLIGLAQNRNTPQTLLIAEAYDSAMAPIKTFIEKASPLVKRKPTRTSVPKAILDESWGQAIGERANADSELAKLARSVWELEKLIEKHDMGKAIDINPTIDEFLETAITLSISGSLAYIPETIRMWKQKVELVRRLSMSAKAKNIVDDLEAVLKVAEFARAQINEIEKSAPNIFSIPNVNKTYKALSDPQVKQKF